MGASSFQRGADTVQKCRLHDAGIHYFSFLCSLGSRLPAANGFFTAASERRLYFTGLLSGQPINYTQVAGQYMPYTVRDVYNMKVLADTLGGIEPQPYYFYPARLPADIIADAQRNLVVRDGWASFFYHTYDSISYLQQAVTGLKALGYTFVAPTAA